jgi:imidazolonepropionase-like amidohydrolase
MDKILTNLLIIDGLDHEPISPAYIIIKGDRIQSLGRQDEINLLTYKEMGYEILDLNGMTALPGLINAHQHLDNRWGKGSFQERAFQPIPWLLMRATRNALLDLHEGVTTVRDLASREGTSLTVKRAIAEGMIVGPRVVTCGQPISMTGGHAWEVSIEADGPDEFRKAARKLLKAGADIIKVMASGGYVDPTKDLPWSPQVTEEEMKAAFDEAKKAGKKTTVHAHPPKAIKLAINAGVDCIEHGALLDQETSELMAEKGIYLVPTLGEGWEIAHRGQELGRPAWLIEATRSHLESRMRTYETAVKAGVKMAVGTDVVGSMALELELMVQGGLNERQALIAATKNGAELCNLEEHIGTLEPNKFADITVVNGNPLKQIKDICNIELVVKGGKFYRPADLANVAGIHPL